MMRIGVAEACLMNLTYKKATIDDLETLVKTRIEATRMGRPLYEKYGFVKMENEMELLD